MNGKQKLTLFLLIATGTCILYIVTSKNVLSIVSRPLDLISSRQTVDKMALQLDRFQRRRDLVKEECQARHDSHDGKASRISGGQFLVDYEHHLAFCYIPKNGCGFWKRVFSIIHGKNKGKTVFNLSDYSIHWNKSAFNTLGRRSVNESMVSLHLRTSKKSLFVRDPYERLFSGYIDKVFASRLFLNQAALVRKHYQGLSVTDQCQPVMTFTEFLQYVTNNRSIAAVNVHFKEQYAICHPCQVDYDFIGKFQTFQEDADFVMREVIHLNPAVVFGSMEKFEENSAVTTLRDLSVAKLRRAEGDKCATKYNTMRRLWIMFQVRGYLSVKEKFPVSRSEADSITAERFQTLLLQAYARSGDRAALKQQRQQALQEAYRSVPLDVLLKAEQFVDTDCRLFGYSCSIRTRFHLDSPKPPPLFHMNEALKP